MPPRRHSKPPRKRRAPPREDRPHLQSETDVLIDLVAEWRASSEAPRHLLRRRADRLRALASRERRDVEQLLFAYVRWRSRVDAVVERAVELLPAEAPRTDPRRQTLLARATLRALGLVAEGGTDTALTPGEARAVEEAIATPVKRHAPATRLAERHAFPLEIVSELLERLGEEEAARALDALNQRAPLVLRPRPPGAADEVLRALADDGIGARLHAQIPDALVIDERVQLERHPVLRRGLAEVQDAASQLAVRALDLSPGQTVIDYCAGGGGKAAAMADLLGARGHLVLMDVDARRLSRARRRTQPVGGLRLETQVHDGNQAPPARLHGCADRVLVDAPCSGLGTVRRHPDLTWRFDRAALQALTSQQRRLTVHASALLRPGGRLLYVTCSLRREENEAVADQLTADTSLRPLALSAALGDLADALGAVGSTLTLWPHRHDSDGFFLALFEQP